MKSLKLVAVVLSTVCFRLDAAPPGNDRFADASAFPVGSVFGEKTGLDYFSSPRLELDLAAATSEPDEPDLNGSPAARSIWFTWTAPADRGCHFDVETSGAIAPRAAVYSGDTLGTLRLESTTVVSAAFPVAIASFRARKGVLYHLVADAATTNNVTKFQASAALFIANANDDFADREQVTLTDGGATAHFRTAGATTEPGEPTVNRAASVWFGFRTPETGAYTIEAGGYDLTLAVFKGTSLGNLVRLATADGEHGRCSLHFVSEAGQECALAVSDPIGFNFDFYTWSLRRDPRYDLTPAPDIRFGTVEVGPPLSLVATNRLALRFQARPLRLYHVETSDDLVHWRLLHFLAPPTADAVVDLGNGEPPGSFLRVVVPD